jgi:RHS repeat-associated protein
MYVANTHLKPVIGIDIHFVNLPFPFIPLPHPYIGLVIDPFDYIPFIGATIKINNVPRGHTDTMGMIITFMHIPFGAGFTLFPMIGHDSQNFFGDKKVLLEGTPMSGAGHMLMTCNDIGIPLSLGFEKLKKKIIPIPSLYLPTSYCIPLQWGKPVMVGGPLTPNFNLMGILHGAAFGAALKVLGKAGGKLLKAVNRKLLSKSPLTQKLNAKLCKMGFEPVDLITGRVNYEYVDFELPGPIPIIWRRNWDSDSKLKGPLGHGVQLSYDRCVQVWPEEGCLSVTMADGRLAVFPLLFHGEEHYHPQEKITLRRKQNGHYILDDYNEECYYHFNYESEPGTWRLSYIENYSSHRVQLHYAEGQLKAITDSAGRQLLMESDKERRITKVIVKHRDLEQTLVSYAYNDKGDLVSITDAMNQKTTIEYRYHLMIKKTDRNGNSFYWEYDAKKRCIHTWGDEGLLEGFIQYNKGFNIVTNSVGENTTYYYDENNLCIRQTDHYGNSKLTEYTDDFEVLRAIDEAGRITGFVYDNKGRLNKQIFPDGTSLQFHYNDYNQHTLVIHPDGSNEVLGYDEQRRLRFINKPNDRTIFYEYNKEGQVAAIVENSKQKSLLSYDEDHNLVSAELPDQTVLQWSFDALGRCTQTINAEGHRRYFEFDALNRVRTLHLPDGNTVKLQYNAYEDITRAKDKFYDLQYEYTATGSLKKSRRNGKELNFLYDTAERLCAIVNEAGQHYRFQHNHRGEVISETGFDGKQVQYQRDGTGRIIKAIRPGGRHTKYEYDANGRIIRIEYHDGTWKSFTYNRSGAVTSMENENGIVQLQRNKVGNVVLEKSGVYEIQTVYDKYGNRTQITSNLGAELTFRHNEPGQVTNIAARMGTTWQSEIKYNPGGAEAERILPGGVSVAWGYDQAGRLQEQKVSRKGVVQSWKKYSWNADNRLTSVFEALSQGNTRFKHDALGNLVFAQYADNTVLHRVSDDVGNIYETKNKTDRTYNGAGALVESNKYTYKYDEEGNLISKTDKTTLKKTQYEWNAAGQLQKVTRPDGKMVEFTYDALDRRISKTFAGKITRWLWNGNTPLHEWTYDEKDKPQAVVNEWGEITYDKEEPNPLNAQGGVKSITWIFDDGSFVPCAKIADGKTYSIVSDYMGTPAAAYDEEGNKVWECTLDIYGRARSITGNRHFIPFRYQGQYEDEETGLYYNRCRYYAPEEGMYISQDPIGLAGNNPTFYGYVNDPNITIDPSGLSGIGSWNAFQQAFKGTFNNSNLMPWTRPPKMPANLQKDAAEGWKWYKHSNHSGDTPVIGNLKDTAKFKGVKGYNVLDSNRWSPGVNKAWVQGGIDAKQNFKLVSPQNSETLWDFDRNCPKVFQDELDMLRAADYYEWDGWMIHPDNLDKVNLPKCR